MKNETARREIESLDYYLQNHTDDYSEESHTAMMMARDALEQEPYKGMTNGEVVKTMFPNIDEMWFDKDWWNSPYEPQESEE